MFKLVITTAVFASTVASGVEIPCNTPGEESLPTPEPEFGLDDKVPCPTPSPTTMFESIPDVNEDDHQLIPNVPCNQTSEETPDDHQLIPNVASEVEPCNESPMTNDSGFSLSAGTYQIANAQEGKFQHAYLGENWRKVLGLNMRDSNWTVVFDPVMTNEFRLQSETEQSRFNHFHYVVQAGFFKRARLAESNGDLFIAVPSDVENQFYIQCTSGSYTGYYLGLRGDRKVRFVSEEQRTPWIFTSTL